MQLFRPSKLQSAATIARHYHCRPYVTVVLSGSYEEAGDAGRICAEPGDVLFHGPFSAHRDSVSRLTTVVLDLPLPLGAYERPARGRIADPDQLVRLAERNPLAAVDHVLDELRPRAEAENDLPDLLATALRSAEPPRIAAWAEECRRSREYVSRQFHAAYGVAPARYRVEAQARRAWRRIVTSQDGLSAVAVDSGYADQAHMARSIKALTGRSPGEWRDWAARTTEAAA